MTFKTSDDIMIDFNINTIKSTAIAISSDITLMTMSSETLRMYEMTFIFDILANRVKSTTCCHRNDGQQVKQRIRQNEDSINSAEYQKPL